MPLKNKTFLSNICLYTFLILGGGCTDEAGMENIGNTDRRIPLTISVTIIRKSKFPQNPKRSVRFSGKRTKRSVQKRKARNTQKAETKVL